MKPAIFQLAVLVSAAVLLVGCTTDDFLDSKSPGSSVTSTSSKSSSKSAISTAEKESTSVETAEPTTAKKGGSSWFGTTSETVDPKLPAEKPTSEAATKQQKADCNPDSFSAHYGAPVVLYCDGQWARAGQVNSDGVGIYAAQNGNWVAYPSDGEALSGYSCYDEAKMRTAGVPEEIISKATLCN